jgi:hypothetical protein
MKCGKTNLCEVEEIKGKYSVTWNKHITGLSVYSDKVMILLDMITKDSKSWEVGIHLSNGYVVWLSNTLLFTLTTRELADYLVRVAKVQDQREVLGAVFDNTSDVETFVDRLEKKYIVHVLKQ